MEESVDLQIHSSYLGLTSSFKADPKDQKESQEDPEETED